jgi:hypothetical protein
LAGDGAGASLPSWNGGGEGEVGLLSVLFSRLRVSWLFLSWDLVDKGRLKGAYAVAGITSARDVLCHWDVGPGWC